MNKLGVLGRAGRLRQVATRLEVSGLRSPKLSASPLQHNHGGSDTG
jgi:hypothetical protein